MTHKGWYVVKSNTINQIHPWIWTCPLIQSKIKKQRMENSVDPDEIACYKLSHLDLHYLHMHLVWSAGLKENFLLRICQPRWLSWMRRPTGDQRSLVQPPLRSATFFRGDWSWNIFTVILSLLLIQEGQLSVSGERMCTILVNRLED